MPATLRGELSRWMIEPRPGVFVGKVSGLVRDRLWDKARAGAKTGAGMLLYSSPTEQGFLAQSFGDTTRELTDWEGLTPCGPLKLPQRKNIHTRRIQI